MYSMMNTTGWGSGLILFWGLHVVSIIVFGVGVALLLIWAFKHLSERGLWKWGWVFVVLGTILCLLTISAWPSFAMGSFGFRGMNGGGSAWMMGGGSQVSQADVAATAKEEAQGKDLYNKLQAKQAQCTDFSDDDFELMGDYFMGQQMGAAHSQMDAMMQQMMGEAANRQMHIIVAKRLTGCSPSSGQFPQGMMNGGGMMGGNSSSADTNAGTDPHHPSSNGR